VADPKPKPGKLKIPESHSAREKRKRDAFNKRIMKAVEDQFARQRLPRPPD
jgi:hypothetical protein